MNQRDRFFRGIVDDLLEEDEHVLYTGTAYSREGLFMDWRAYYVAVTNQNVILIETLMGAWGIKCDCLSVSVIALSDVVVVYRSAILNQKQLMLHTRHGDSISLGINSLARQVSGHRKFCREGLAYIYRVVSEQNASKR